jgi:phosphoribosylanthranilate isomerase
MTVDVKICGLRDEIAVAAAVEGGAAMVGFVFFPPSPRFITVERASELTKDIPKDVTRVGLVVDADDQWLEKIATSAGIDMFQLHGEETPKRTCYIRKMFGLPIIKALPVKESADLANAFKFEGVVERLMFDAKPPEGASRPGGNAQVFDWSLLSKTRFKFPWILAGGLRADNVGDAVKISGAKAVDVSSGVEDISGCKNEEKIRVFLAASAAL